MSDDKEDPNEFETGQAHPDLPQPEVQTAAEETAPEPAKVEDAVKRALQRQAPGVTQVQLEPCPCGTVNVNLLVDLPQGSKVGHGTCGSCGVWGVDFLAPRTNDKELIANAAAKSWNEAPRIAATDPA